MCPDVEIRILQYISILKNPLNLSVDRKNVLLQQIIDLDALQAILDVFKGILYGKCKLWFNSLFLILIFKELMLVNDEHVRCQYTYTDYTGEPKD